MKQEVIVDQRRVNAFYRTSMVVTVIVELLRCKRVRDEPAYTKMDSEGNRQVVPGVRATCIYFAMKKLGMSQSKTKEILDAMVMKSRFLVRELAVLVETREDGSQYSNQEYVYELRDRDEIDEAVINALHVMPEYPFQLPRADREGE